MGDCSTSIGTQVLTSANVQVSQVPTPTYVEYTGADGVPMMTESTIYNPVSYTNYDVVTQTIYGPCPTTAATPPPETQAPAPTTTSSPPPDSPPPASSSSPAQIVTETVATTAVQTQVLTSMATATQTVVSSTTSSGFVLIPVAGNRSTVEIRHQVTVVGNVSSTVFLDGSGHVVSLTTDASGATAIIGGANTSSESSAAEKGQSPMGAIIGGVVGAAVIAILALLFCIRRRKNRVQLRERQSLSAKNMAQLSGVRYGHALPSDDDDARTVYSQASGAPAQLGSSAPADWSHFGQQGYGTSASNSHAGQVPRSPSSAYTSSYAGDTVRSARSITPQEQKSWFNGRGLSIFTKTESRRPSTRGSIMSNNSSLTIKRVEKGAIGSPTNFVHHGTGDDAGATMGYYNTVSEKGALGSLSRSGSVAETVQLRQLSSPSPKPGADLSRNSSVVSSVATGLSDFDWYRSPSAMSSEAKQHGMRTPSPAIGTKTEWRSSARTDVNDFEMLDIDEDDEKKMGTFGRRPS